MTTGFLNTENIKRNTGDVEFHPLKPFIPPNAKILFLGSFPPPRKRWCMDFYYPNFINDHWRIEGAVFFHNRDYFVDKESKTFRAAPIIDFCNRKGIAFFDTATAVRRLKENASDKFLEVVQPTDLWELTGGLPQLKAIVTTGEKATLTLCERLGIAVAPKVGHYVAIPQTPWELYRLPSSSRAYPMAFEKKADAYRNMFQRYLDKE